MTDAVKIIAEHGDGTTRGHFLTSGSSGDSILVRRGVVSSKNVTSWAAGLEPLIICHFFFGTHVQHMVWLRGNALTAHTAGGSGTSDPGTSSTTQTLNIGSRNNAASLLLTGEIASYALFSPALSPSRMMAVAHMLSRKYGCAVA
jgi:hypothetical protein